MLGALNAIAVGAQPITYAWERSRDNGATWTTVQTQTGYDGRRLRLASVALAEHGTQYRLRASNTAGAAVSAAAQLKVQPLPGVRRKMLHLRCDENAGTVAADASGRGHPGKLYGQSGFTSTSGKFGGAFQLPKDVVVGVNSHADLRPVTIPGDPDQYPVSTYSAMAWVKADAGGRVVGLGFDNPDREWIIGLDETLHPWVWSQRQELRSATTISAGAWHHLCITSDSLALRLYVDGQLTDTMPLTRRYLAQHYSENQTKPDQLIGFAMLRIGGSHDARNKRTSLVGAVDEVRLYDFVLTPSEIATVMANGEPPLSGGDNVPPAAPSGLSAVLR